jgi:hypothetical protein
MKATSGRLLSVAVCAVLSASAAQAQDKQAVNETQLPQQVLPTGAEDAAPAAATFARAAASSATSDAALMEQLIESTSESDEGLVEETLADGTVMLDLQERFMSVMVATPTADGGTVVGCHTGDDAVEHAKHAHDHAAGKAPGRKIPATLNAPAALEEK